MITRNTKRACGAILFLAISSAAWGAQSGYDVLVTAERVNVRAQPTTESAVLFQVTRGETLHLLEDAGSWYRVQGPGKPSGYVYKTLVKLIEIRSDSPESLEGSTSSSGLRSAPTSVDRPSSSPPDDDVQAAQARSWADKRKKAMYKIAGGAAGVVTGLIVMDSSKPVGIGLVGAGGYFVWDGYRERQEAGRRLRWAIYLQMDRDTKGVAYQMSW